MPVFTNLSKLVRIDRGRLIRERADLKEKDKLPPPETTTTPPQQPPVTQTPPTGES